MKKLYTAFIVIVLAKSLLVSLTPASYALNGENNAQSDFLNMFDGKYPKVNIRAMIFTYPIPVPQNIHVVPSNNERKMLYQILAEQEESGNKSRLTIQEILIKLGKEYGKSPSTDDNKHIQQALVILQGTKFGSEICKSVAYGCSLENIKKAGIEFRVNKEIDAAAEVPPPVYWGGHIYIGLGKILPGNGAAPSPEALALTILHEMSHAEDLQKNKLGTLAQAEYATEEKALLLQLAVYDEITRKYPFFSAILDTTLDIWKWKNENGPYPKHQFIDNLRLGPDGTPSTISSEELIRTYVEPAFPLSFQKAYQNLVHALWEHYYGNPKVDPLLVGKIRQATTKTIASYQSWRKNPLGPPATPQPPHQQPPGQPQPLPNPQPIPVPHPQPVPQPVPPQPPQPKPALSVSVNSLTFYGQEGQYSPSSENIGIRNSGEGILNWGISSDASWLSFRPASGSSTGETDYASVDVDDSGLSVGTYRAEITVSAGSLAKTVHVEVIIEPYEIDVDVSNR